MEKPLFHINGNEDTYREITKQFYQLTEQSDLAFWFLQLDPLQIHYVSPAFERIWGISAKELYCNPDIWTKSIHTEDIQRINQVFNNWINGKIDKYDVEYRIVRNDGGIRWIHNRGTLVRNHDGAITKAGGMAEDISERKLAEYNLKQTASEILDETNTKLKELDHLKSAFISSMSHELRTPLNSIIGFIGIILQGMTGEITQEQRDMLQRSYDASKQLLALISDVIDISRIEAGRVETDVEEFQLDSLINGAIMDIKSKADKKNLSVKTIMPQKIQLRTDRKRLLQCLLNLLSNAIKFTKKGGIKIKARKTRGMVEIAVEDTGIGIKKEDLSKLFVSFIRLESPLKITTTGTGLGLYLTRKLVTEILKGDVSVSSTFGKGSSFAIKIPEKI